MHLELVVLLEEQVRLACLVLKGRLGLLEARELQVLQASQVAPVPRDHKELPVILVPRAQLEMPDPVV